MKTSKLNLCRLKSHSHPLKKYEFWHDLQCIWTLILGLRQLYEDKNFFLIDIDWLPIDWYHQISVDIIKGITCVIDSLCNSLALFLIDTYIP